MMSIIYKIIFFLLFDRCDAEERSINGSKYSNFDFMNDRGCLFGGNWVRE